MNKIDKVLLKVMVFCASMLFAYVTVIDADKDTRCVLMSSFPLERSDKDGSLVLTLANRNDRQGEL